MNLYIRYFDNEAFLSNADEVINFLHSISEIDLDKDTEDDIREYIASDVFYPKRYKVRPRVYFILIKTTAQSMQDFKDKKAVHSSMPANEASRSNGQQVPRLTEELPGWYEGELDFKRVVMIPETGKHEYRDTHFVADCKAMSGQDCYDRIVDYLHQFVDPRSQFPSAKGKNFHFKYLGMWK